MLTDLYNLANIAPGDFHDITSGNNFGYPAGQGYDLVTGLGSPKANLLIPHLAAFGPASEARIDTEPPPSLVAGASFGIIVAATNSFGITDLGYNGTATLTLASGPRGASFTAVTTPVTNGLAVVQTLSLGGTAGSSYGFQVAINGLGATTTSPVTVSAPKPGVGYFYPLPLAKGLEEAVAAADSNSFARNIITLSVSSIPYPVSSGQLVIDNGSGLLGKVFTLVGQGESSSVIDAQSTSRSFRDRGEQLGPRGVLAGLEHRWGSATDGGHPGW